MNTQKIHQQEEEVMLWDLYGLSLTTQENRELNDAESMLEMSPKGESAVRRELVQAPFSCPSGIILVQALRKKVGLRILLHFK